VLRKRTGACLRALRACLEQPTVAGVRRFDAALDELADVEEPLRVLRRKASELAWYASVADIQPDVHRFAATGDDAAVPKMRRLLGSVAAELRPA
jgi:hypothetical protein